MGPEKSGLTKPLHPAIESAISKILIILIIINYLLIEVMQSRVIVSILTTLKIAPKSSVRVGAVLLIVEFLII